jgi:hypothetical protein
MVVVNPPSSSTVDTDAVAAAWPDDGDGAPKDGPSCCCRRRRGCRLCLIQTMVPVHPQTNEIKRDIGVTYFDDGTRVGNQDGGSMGPTMKKLTRKV